MIFDAKMRINLILFLSTVLFAGIQAVSAETSLSAEGKARLSVTIQGVRSAEGGIEVELFDDADAFPTDASRAVATEYVVLSGEKEVTVEFAGLEPGMYAVGAYHDEDGNHKLKQNFLGIPKEGVGASNDAKGRLGPPRFDKAKVELTEQAHRSITFQINY